MRRIALSGELFARELFAGFSWTARPWRLGYAAVGACGDASQPAFDPTIWVIERAVASRDEDGWDIQRGLNLLQATMDPYLWDQGKELFSRDAVEDFAIQASGDIQVRVLDPRDARIFFVQISKGNDGIVRAICRCPYQLGGHCRHQVVALKYLEAVQNGDIDPTEGRGAGGDDVESSGSDRASDSRPILYRLFDTEGEVSTQPDGSLLRVALRDLGSSRKPHRAGLQLYTGTGWTELRTSDTDRWIGRGGRGAHRRDVILTKLFLEDEILRTEVDSDTLAEVLTLTANTEALVDRSGSVLRASRVPWRLSARLVAGDEHAVGVELVCLSPDGEESLFSDVALIPAVAPWIQDHHGAFHPLLAGVGGAVLEELQEEDLSSIPPEGLDQFLTEGVKTLERLCLGRIDSADGLIADVEGVEAARVELTGSIERFEGFLEFRYGEEWVEAPSTPEPWSIERDGKVVRYPPAGQSMARAQRELEGLGFFREAGAWILQGPQSLAKVLGPRKSKFVELVLPSELTTLDLVARAPRLRVDVSGAPGWAARHRSGGGGGDRTDDGEGSDSGGSKGRTYSIDWFEANVSLYDGDRELPVDLGEICRAAMNDPEGVLQLEDGSVLGLSHDCIDTITKLVRRHRSGEDEQKSLKLSLPGVAELVADDNEADLFFEDELRDFAAALRGGEGLEVPPLTDRLEEMLRPYQHEAVRWFGGLARWAVGGILADEMGLGKTVMTLAHFFGRREDDVAPGISPEGAVLVVCPTSLVFNWQDECKRFCPDVVVASLGGRSPSEREEIVLGEHELVITSYALLRRDRELLESREFRAVVLDEGQHIKNSESQTAKAAFALRARERFVLTGTPLENHLGDLWSLFHFLMPGFLGSAKDFQKGFAEAVRRGEDQVIAGLRARVRPFLLRRTKEQVLADLPPRIEQVERVPLSRSQQALYDAFLAEARSDLSAEDSEKSRFKVLAALTRLRQICCDPRLIDDESEPATNGDSGEKRIASAKFDLLMELLQECVDEGHRVLLFSQFTSMLDLIEEGLKDVGIRRCRLDGSTKDRESEVRRFQQDDGIPVFLISLKAGGYGLNLTQADTVILYDPWWNPAVEEQAAARAHRMGQSLPVHVHRLVAAGTVEEKILDLQHRKKDLAESIVAADGDVVEKLDLHTLRGILLEG